MRRPGIAVRVLVVPLAAGSLLLGAISAAGQASTVGCTDTSTACLDAVAMSYINALDGKGAAAANAVRAAPDVQRWENGVHNVSTRAQLVAEIRTAQLEITGIRDVRLFPDRSGENVFAMYLVDGGLVKGVSVTSHVIERVGISNGLIAQIEVVECIGGPNEQSMPKVQDPSGALDLNICVRIAAPVLGR
jgi:hypothetical protein